MTYLISFLLMLSVLFFLCCHMMIAAIPKNPKFSVKITITGAVKAQMKWVDGFKKHL